MPGRALISLLVAPLAWSADVSDNELRMIGEGRVLYLAHCAQCHGHDGKATVAEDGRSVPNLDGIERRDGAFGFQHVADHVSGDWARRHVTWLERQDGRYMPDWHYVLRVQDQTVSRDSQGREKPLHQLVRLPGQRRKLRGEVFKKRGWRPRHVVVYWGRRHKSPLCLISDLGARWYLIRLYRRRYPIEATFRDYKSSGRQWEQGQVTHHSSSRGSALPSRSSGSQRGRCPLSLTNSCGTWWQPIASRSTPSARSRRGCSTLRPAAPSGAPLRNAAGSGPASYRSHAPQ